MMMFEQVHSEGADIPCPLKLVDGPILGHNAEVFSIPIDIIAAEIEIRGAIALTAVFDVADSVKAVGASQSYQVAAPETLTEDRKFGYVLEKKKLVDHEATQTTHHQTPYQ
jgi:hypothetical protein